MKREDIDKISQAVHDVIRRDNRMAHHGILFLAMLRQVIPDPDQIFDSLTPRQKKVMKIRFGLEDGVTHTLDEVGKEFGVTSNRIRQMEEKALESMRYHLKTIL